MCWQPKFNRDLGACPRIEAVERESDFESFFSPIRGEYWVYSTKTGGKRGQNRFSAVGSLFSDRLLALLLLVFAITACSRQPQLHEHQYLTFGTIVTVTIAGSTDDLAEQAFNILEEDFTLLHENWHAWKPGSLGRVNTLLPYGKPFSTGPEMVSMITKAQKISRDSEYLFNPALGKLIALWGFHQDQPEKQIGTTTTQIQALLKTNPTLDDIQINGIDLQCSNPAVQLDFGGFAKGYALNLAAERLLELGLSNFVINAGGDLVAYGKHPQRPWKIGVRDPREARVLATIEAQDGEGIFSSGDYERYYLEADKRRHHIIDPRNGMPSEGARAVTVIHQDAALADAAATALMIASDTEWRRIAKKLGVTQVLRVNDSGEIVTTKQMAARISIESNHPKN